MEIPYGREIRQTLFAMGPFKSLGPDGMTVIFYKKYWATVGSKVVETLPDIFRTRYILDAFNHTFKGGSIMSHIIVQRDKYFSKSLSWTS